MASDEAGLLAQEVVAACVCDPDTPLPDDWIALSTTTLPSRLRALLNIAALELLALGLPNKEIALQLNISPATVREHVSDLLKLFACDNRTQAVLKARQLGFILD